MLDSSHRYSESNFRRFENDISAVLENYPKATLIQCTEISTETYEHRFRDAVTALASSDWSTTIDRGLLPTTFSWLRQGGSFIVKQINHEIYIGPRITRTSPLESAVRLTDVPNKASDGEVDGENRELVRALALVKHHDLMEGPVIVINLPANFVAELEAAHPNLVIVEDAPNRYVML